MARAWRTPLLGELTMGFTTRWGFRRALPAEIADRAFEEFDHGTQRAVLRLYRASPPEVLARHGERLGELRCPALVAWPTHDPYIGTRVRRAPGRRARRRGRARAARRRPLPVVDRPEVIDRVAAFVG